jgi:hypothetical protein
MSTAGAVPVSASDTADVRYDADFELAAENAGKLSTACCGLTLRALVSRKKLRFVSAGVDLDLSYITNRLIAMGYPSIGFEALYRWVDLSTS